MVYIPAVPCNHPDGCTAVPTHNVKGEAVAIRCATHREEGMKRVIPDGKCEVCGENAAYSEPGCTDPIRCIKHKDTNMIHANGRNCATMGCTKAAQRTPGNGPQRLCWSCYRDANPRPMRTKTQDPCTTNGCNEQAWMWSDTAAELPFCAKCHDDELQFEAEEIAVMDAEAATRRNQARHDAERLNQALRDAEKQNQTRDGSPDDLVEPMQDVNVQE